MWSSTYVCPPPFNLVEMASTRTAPLAYDWVQVRQMEKQSRFFRGLLASRGSGSKQVIPTFRCCQLAIIPPPLSGTGQPANIIAIPYAFFCPLLYRPPLLHIHKDPDTRHLHRTAAEISGANRQSLDTRRIPPRSATSESRKSCGGVCKRSV